MANTTQVVVVLFLILHSVISAYIPFLSEHFWIVPSASLPSEVHPQTSNNCVGITLYQGRIFMGWRTAPSHFASDKTQIYIVSAPFNHTGGIDYNNLAWEYEHMIYMGSDMREPHFLEMDGTLIFSFFQAGTDPLAFEPQYLFRIVRKDFQEWTEPEVWGHPEEIVWQIGVHDGIAYASSYSGNHYNPSLSALGVFFNQSKDGFTWEPVNPAQPILYFGGVSEVGWTFDDDGNLWGVMRNEDGDETGFGSHVVFAPASDIGNWTVYPTHSDPWIYESPKMFTHENEVYLIARRDINGPYDRGHTHLGFDAQKYINLSEYSLRAHTTALWRINKDTKELEWIFDLPGDGDTAFPSIIRLGKHKFLVANYTSPLNHPDWSWVEGQTSDEGTQIYFIEIEFSPAK